MNKRNNRNRRAQKTRSKLRSLNAHRLSIHRTTQHIYAQVFTPDGSKVIASASTLDKDLRESINNGGNISAAQVIGQEIAKRAIAAGITNLSFDRSGFKYHGRVKALADSARESGLSF